MPLVPVRMSDEQLQAIRNHGGGNASLGVRRLIVEVLGVGEAAGGKPYFADRAIAKRESKRGIAARYGKRRKS